MFLLTKNISLIYYSTEFFSKNVEFRKPPPLDFEGSPKSTKIAQVAPKLFKIESLALPLVLTLFQNPFRSAPWHHFGRFLMNCGSLQTPVFMSLHDLITDLFFEPKITNRGSP